MADAKVSEATIQAFLPLLGEWKQDRLENQSDKLEYQGYNWIMRTMLLAAPTTYMFTMDGASVKMVINIIGAKIPSSDIVLNSKTPARIEALGRVTELWFATDENGIPYALAKGYLSKKALANGTPDYTTRTAWTFPPDGATHVAEDTTSVAGQPDVVSTAWFNRAGSPVVASSA